ncbi:hypothetical protein PTKIN_Ptkin18bG0083700 [Pterospermum kingtungense]
MDPSAPEARKKRSTRGRQRIEIKKLEDRSKRFVTFSKRKKGLFKKAKEVSKLCGAEVGVLTLSKSGKLFTSDDVDGVVDRFLGESGHGNFGFVLDQPMENLTQLELEGYAMALKELRENAAARLEEQSIQNSTCLLPWVVDQELNIDGKISA